MFVLSKTNKQDMKRKRLLESISAESRLDKIGKRLRAVNGKLHAPEIEEEIAALESEIKILNKELDALFEKSNLL